MKKRVEEVKSWEPFKLSKDWIQYKHSPRLKDNGFIGYDSDGVFDMWVDGLFYEINQLGHRCEFIPDDKDYGVAVGCSHTFGSSLNLKDLYHQNLDTKLPVYNLGVGGSSNQVSIHNLSNLLLNHKKPSFVIFQISSKERFTGIELKEKIKYMQNFGVWSLADEGICEAMLCLDEVSAFDIRLQTDIKIVEALCRDIPLVFATHSNFVEEGEIKTTAPQYFMKLTKTSADNMHSCKEDHLRWAKDLSEIIKKGPKPLNVYQAITY